MSELFAKLGLIVVWPFVCAILLVFILGYMGYLWFTLPFDYDKKKGL